MNIVLVTQTFGKETEYRRAIFSIYSLFAFIPKTQWGLIKIALHTDSPEYFKKLLEAFNVHYFVLTPEKIKQMRGEIDFLHRMKIALLEETFDAFPNHLLYYTDSDTFSRTNLFDFLDIQSEKDMYMHTDEYAFSALNNPNYTSENPFRLYYEKVVNQTFKVGETQFQITENLHSLNAGVMCFHPLHNNYLEEVYSLTDQTYPLTKNHAAEQYAFSIVFQLKTKIKFIENEHVFHYWHRVQKEYMDHYLSGNHFLFSPQTTDQKMEKLIPILIKLPTKIKNSHYSHLDHAIQNWNNDLWMKGNWHFLVASLKKPVLFFSNFRHLLYHAKRIFLKQQ